MGTETGVMAASAAGPAAVVTIVEGGGSTGIRVSE